MSFPCVYQGIHVAKSISGSATRSQTLFSANVYCIRKTNKQTKKQNTSIHKQTKRNSDICISTFLGKRWAGFCQINSAHCSSCQLDDGHVHSAGKGSILKRILKMKPIFLFEGRSEPGQADLAGSCRSSWHPAD